MKTRKLGALMLTLAMLLGLLPQMALAAEPVTIDLSTVSADGAGYTCQEQTVNSKTEYEVTITADGDYILTGTVTQDSHPTHVVVSATTANITLSNASITIVNFSPFAINSGSTVNLTLAAGTENTLSLGTSEVHLAGLYVPVGASIVIGGTGTLNASGGTGGNGAGIGGGFNQYTSIGDKNAGDITINSGVINAVGGPGGAGIGGAAYGTGGTVTINGGEINASSSPSSSEGSGIGGGYFRTGNVVINGGTVIADGGDNWAYAIGDGYGASGSSVKLNGGSIRTLSPMITPINDSGENLYQTTVTVKDNSGNALDNTELSCTVDATTFTAKTDADGKLYLWLPEGAASISVNASGTVYKAGGTVATDNNTALTAQPDAVASVNNVGYVTWSAAISAVPAGGTITLLKDFALLPSDTMPTVAFTIDGNFHTLTLSSNQHLNADITLKNLCLTTPSSSDWFTLSCTDTSPSSTRYKLTINGTVAAANIYFKNGSELSVDGTLEIGEMDSFDAMIVAANSTVSAFAVRNIGSLVLNGTIMCQYFTLSKSTGDSGTLSGTGTFIFTSDGGESPNLIFENVNIDSTASITLDTAADYTPSVNSLVIGNQTIKTGETAPGALDHIDRLHLSGGYSSFRLADDDDTYVPEYTYWLKANTIPTLKSGVSATATASVVANSAYTLDLANVFADADTDTLTYKVSVNGATAVTANANYSHTPTAAGTTTLEFKANDGAADSTDTYTVTLTATGGGSTGDGGGNIGGGSSTGTPKVTTTTSGSGSNAVTTAGAEVSGNVTGGKQTVPVPTDIMIGLTDAAKKAESAGGTAVASIDTGSGSGLTNVGVTIPGAQFNALASGTGAALQIKTGLGSVTFSSKAVDTIGSAGSGDVTVGIGAVDKTTLSADEQKVVGSRPVYSFSVTVGNTKVSEFGGSVTVSVPYTLGANEDPNAIVVYYIDASGKLQPMQGKYDTKTGAVTFETTHFSEYMIGYNKVTFNDVPSTAWYSDAVTFIAARSIATGTGNGSFSPDAKLTRGEFLVMMMRAYSISADTNPTDNFEDAGNTYYTNYLAAAKRLGISTGVGDNRFAPEQDITRQEMFTLLYNALKTIDQLPDGNSGKTLSDFSDSESISAYAQEAMSYLIKTGVVSGNNGQLSPTATTTRAQMAQVLHNLLSK